MSAARSPVPDEPEDKPYDDHHDVGELVSRIATEIELLRLVSERLERSVCVRTEENLRDPAALSEIQQFDFLLQHLAALRDFLAELARVSNADWRINPTLALNNVALEALKRRLAGEFAAAEAQSHASGEIEMF